MDSIGSFSQLDTAIDRATALKSAYAEFVEVIEACVTERLQVAGVHVDAARAMLIADAVREVVQDTIYRLGRDEREFIKDHTLKTIDEAVRVVLTITRQKKNV